MVLPLVTITLVLVFAAVGIYYMIYRARYGAFCCLNPVRVLVIYLNQFHY